MQGEYLILCTLLLYISIMDELGSHKRFELDKAKLLEGLNKQLVTSRGVFGV